MPSSADLLLKPHPLINKFSIVTALSQWTRKSFTVRNGGPTRVEDYFLSPVMQRREMTHHVPTKAFLQPSPEAAMLSQPSVETCPPPPVPSFLLAEPKYQGHCRKWHHKFKICQHQSKSLVVKGILHIIYFLLRYVNTAVIAVMLIMHNGLSSCLQLGNTFGWLCKAYIPHLGDSSVSKGFFPREHVSIPHTSSMLQTYAPYRIPFMYLNHHELISTHYSNRPYSRLNLDLWPRGESSWTLSWWTNIVWSPLLSQSNKYISKPRLWLIELSKDGTYSPSRADWLQLSLAICNVM